MALASLSDLEPGPDGQPEVEPKPQPPPLPDWSPDFSVLTPTQKLVAEAILDYSRTQRTNKSGWSTSMHVSLWTFRRELIGEGHYGPRPLNPEFAAFREKHRPIVGHLSADRMRAHIRGINRRQDQHDPARFLRLDRRGTDSFDVLWPDLLEREAAEAAANAKQREWIDRIEESSPSPSIRLMVHEAMWNQPHYTITASLDVVHDKDTVSVVADWLAQNLQRFSPVLVVDKTKVEPKVEPEEVEDDLDD